MDLNRAPDRKELNTTRFSYSEWYSLIKISYNSYEVLFFPLHFLIFLSDGKLGRATSLHIIFVLFSCHLKFVTLPSVIFLVLLQNHWLSALLVLALSDLYSPCLWLLVRIWHFTCLHWSYCGFECQCEFIGALSACTEKGHEPWKTTLMYPLLRCYKEELLDVQLASFSGLVTSLYKRMYFYVEPAQLLLLPVNSKTLQFWGKFAAFSSSCSHKL